MRPSESRAAGNPVPPGGPVPGSHVTLTCPSCDGTLRVQADRDAEGPCPICSHPLKYLAAAPPTVEEPRSVLRRADNFLNTRTGIAFGWCMVGILLLACALLLVHWNKERVQRSIRDDALQSIRPPASRVLDPNKPVPLLPGEPPPAAAAD